MDKDDWTVLIWPNPKFPPIGEAVQVELHGDGDWFTATWDGERWLGLDDGHYEVWGWRRHPQNFPTGPTIQAVSDKIMWDAVNKLPADRRRWGALYLVRVFEGRAVVSLLEPPPQFSKKRK